MILSQISYLDCIAFLVFLAPQLFIQIGLFPVLKWLIPALPWLGTYMNHLRDVTLMLTAPKVFVIPYQFVRERFFTPHELRTPFVKKATPFQDFVIRFVRFAFASLHRPDLLLQGCLVAISTVPDVETWHCYESDTLDGNQETELPRCVYCT
jgi:hypothetical protein